jgi:hypothetical protein
MYKSNESNLQMTEVKNMNETLESHTYKILCKTKEVGTRFVCPDVSCSEGFE